MDDKGIIELLQKMVRAPSHKGIPRQEGGTVGALDEYLRARGIGTTLVEVQPGRPNLIATLEGRAPGRHLLLCGHTDTVPPNEGAVDPFSARIENGRMFGRGTVDMKGALAAMSGALAALQASAASPPGGSPWPRSSTRSSRASARKR
jgi:acetylornithine deacetylase/succinyl-diaminopimelate desuccinylase